MAYFQHKKFKQKLYNFFSFNLFIAKLYNEKDKIQSTKIEETATFT